MTKIVWSTPNVVVLVIFLVGLIVVAGWLLHVIVMLLPVIAIVILVAFLFQYFNKSKGRK